MPPPSTKATTFAKGPAQSRCQRVVGCRKRLPDVGTEASEEPFMGPAGSHPSPPRLLWLSPSRWGEAAVTLAHGVLRVQSGPGGGSRSEEGARPPPGSPQHPREAWRPRVWALVEVV